MRKIGETLFDITYLVLLVIFGWYYGQQATVVSKLFAVLTLLLGLGDTCHLLPRLYKLYRPNWPQAAFWLGFGKLVTSLTLTFFYVFLYILFFHVSHELPPSWLNWLVGCLALSRLLLCLAPANRWFTEKQPYNWKLYRNLPFFLLGLLVGILYQLGGRLNGFGSMGLAIFLSFLFYLPVVLGADRYRALGALMLPKTCVYIWIISMGL